MDVNNYSSLVWVQTDWRALKSRGDDVTAEEANRTMTGTHLARLGRTDDRVPGSVGVRYG